MKLVLKSRIIKALVALAIIVAVVLGVTLTRYSKPLPSNALALCALQVSKGANTVALSLSNTLNRPIVFQMNGNTPSFIMSFEIEGVWTNTSTPRISGGPYLLSPHESVMVFVEIPQQVTGAKFGLAVTPLSPRTRWAFKLQQSLHLEVLRPLTKRLFAFDERQTAEVWSDIVRISAESEFAIPHKL